MTYFTLIPIFLSALAAFFVGFLWYSKALFQQAWLQGEGVSENKVPKHPNSYLLRVGLYSFIAHGCIAAVIALIFDIAEVNSLRIALSLGALLSLGMIASTRYIDMMYTLRGMDYEIKNQIKFLVSAGYYVAVCEVISAVLFFVTR